MKVLLLNSMCGKGSTGRIVEGIAQVLQERGHEVRIAYSLGESDNPIAFHFGSEWDHKFHRLMSHAFDMQGLWSKKSTNDLIDFIKEYQPDIVNLHNIHGNFLNYPGLFNFLAESKIQTVWTLHDCWSFTGHCPHFEFIGCEKWKTRCHDCKQLYVYPKSEWWDGSKRNYALKKKYFTLAPEHLHIVTVSHWLENLAKQSLLKDSKVLTINNGIDLQKFKIIGDTNHVREKYGIDARKIVLAVASPWSERKGLHDLHKLYKYLDAKSLQLVIVGLSPQQIHDLPKGIIGIPRTDGIEELASLYSMADVFVNPTYEDSFPTVNLEALACGTPVVTYKSGGSPDAVSDETGVVVPQGDIRAVSEAIFQVLNTSGKFSKEQCRERAVEKFETHDSFSAYVDLFESLKSK